ncbi:MAG: AbrB/MazE/SpoVT family DNA-binding domain-containing protein [Candidatus Thermoplasmatota archaeon]|nr:AbrB/MazE/SpoVT family DNA-binding domain-containing protein [Candidatus Thermoplasmatota archaeon]MCG2827176.1 AbrB/MazE/SpoVT family DNA-binding domain-containing protein [Thermoplasmatales archaeon]
MQEYKTRISTKGQIVIPKEIREKYMLGVGKTIVIFEDVDGSIRIMPKMKLCNIKINVDLDPEEVEKEIEKMREEKT